MFKKSDNRNCMVEVGYNRGYKNWKWTETHRHRTLLSAALLDAQCSMLNAQCSSIADDWYMAIGDCRFEYRLRYCTLYGSAYRYIVSDSFRIRLLRITICNVFVQLQTKYVRSFSNTFSLHSRTFIFAVDCISWRRYL